MVSLPMTAVAQTNQVELPELVELGQRKVRTFSHRVNVVDNGPMGKLRRGFMHTIPTATLLFFEYPITDLFPKCRCVETVQVSFGNQAEDPRRWPEIRIEFHDLALSLRRRMIIWPNL